MNLSDEQKRDYMTARNENDEVTTTEVSEVSLLNHSIKQQNTILELTRELAETKAELDREENTHRYTKLELNTKTVRLEEAKESLKELRLQIKKLKKDVNSHCITQLTVENNFTDYRRNHTLERFAYIIIIAALKYWYGW